VAEDAISTLIALIVKADLGDIQKQGNPSLCIRHLCMQSSIKTPLRPLDISINALKQLISMGGLRNLSTLTLQIPGCWDETGPEEGNFYIQIPPLFYTDLKKKCPNLKAINLSYLTIYKDEWIEPDIFSIKVYIMVFVHVSCLF
jgi:hypothetical protein